MIGDDDGTDEMNISLASRAVDKLPGWTGAKFPNWCGRLLLVVLVLAVAIPARGQPKPESKSTPVPEQTPVAAAIPLADVVAESEAALAFTRELLSDLNADQSTQRVLDELPAISREIDDRLRETRVIVGQQPSVDVLISLEGEWNRLGRELSERNKNVSARITDLQRQIAELDKQEKSWDQTLAAAREGGAPPEVMARIETVLAEIRRVRQAADKQRGRTLTVQSRVAVQDSRIADALNVIAAGRDNVLNRVFRRDSPPIWNSAFGSAQSFQQESVTSFARQWAALSAYAERQTLRFVLWIVIVALLTAAIFWMRRRVQAISTEGAELSRTEPIFEMPLAAALLLSLLASGWIFPQAPRLLSALLGALALMPSIVILRRLLSARLHAILYTLLVFFVLDQLRLVTAAIHLLPRLLFLLELVGAMFLALSVRRLAVRTEEKDSRQVNIRRLSRVAGNLGVVAALAAIVANIFGYATFSLVLGGALLDSGYLALVLYASVEVSDELGAIVLSARPLSALSAVSRHRALLRRRVRRALQALAICLWILALLQRLLLLELALDGARQLLAASLVVGSIHVSLGDVLAFGLTVWAAFLVSRFVRFLLDEDIYPRVQLKRGLSYAISNTLHYLILIVGFFVAMAALGFDMTRLTILAGAFSVGVGFGLQNIFNNFVSGLILLFERPINIGDIIQIDDSSGIVERIGIRASIIRSANGGEIIMPNGKLISERLINWTISNRQNAIVLAVAVAQNADAKHVIDLLQRAAAAHPQISEYPPPQALVIKLGADLIALELRAWTDHGEQWMQIRSELGVAVSAALAAEKIATR